MKRFLLFGLLFFFAVANAQSLHPELVLNKITQVKASEKKDEIYLTITEFSSTGKNRHYTIPQYPITWPQAALPQVKDLSVWKNTLAPGESAEIVVSVVEHDVPPWNTDDLVGTMKLRLKNTNGQLQHEWAYMGSGVRGMGTKLQTNLNQVFNFDDAEGEYKLNFQLLENNSAAMPTQQKTTG